MAATPINPKNGAVSWGTMGTTGADFASFDVDAGQAVDNVTPYGSNTCTVNVGSGTPDFVFNVGAFGLVHGATTYPNLANNTGGTSGTSGTAFSSGGASATFTLDSNTTYSGTVILQRFRISHARMRGFVPLAMTFRNSAEITEAWAIA